MLKILGGEFRSRILNTPHDSAITRPYAGRVRESVFNLLRGWFEGTRVLDLFAGVGTIGLECISRGAKEAVMVEQHREIVALLKQNIEELDCGDRARVIAGDALSAMVLTTIRGPFDLVFIDPPYRLMEDDTSRQRVFTQMKRCRALMGDKGFLVLRSPIAPDDNEPMIVEGFDGPEPHHYGADRWVFLYAPRAGAVLSTDERTNPDDSNVS